MVGLCSGLCGWDRPASPSPLLLQYVHEKPVQYRYEAPSPELCEQIRSVRSVQRWPRMALPCPLHGWPRGMRVLLLASLQRIPKLCLAPCHRAALARGSVSPAGSLLTPAPPVWFCRISKAMLKWACWMLTEREVDS